ncbi:hypothetical protein MERGE_001106, partial [Pneumocystis wakefieldiae]
MLEITTSMKEKKTTDTWVTSTSLHTITTTSTFTITSTVTFTSTQKGIRCEAEQRSEHKGFGNVENDVIRSGYNGNT